MGADDVVVVSGGGVAGLALAAALARERERRGGDGATCVVLERDESAAARFIEMLMSLRAPLRICAPSPSTATLWCGVMRSNSLSCQR